jgi:hypothetical protein
MREGVNHVVLIQRLYDGMGQRMIFQRMSGRMFPPHLIGIPRYQEISRVLSSGLYKYFNYVAKRGLCFLCCICFWKGITKNVLWEVSSKGCMVVWVLFCWVWEKRFLKGDNQECFMGGVIQRLYDFMGFILLSMRERVFERG